MDKWLWYYIDPDSKKIECPVCEHLWEIKHPYTVADYRHCPWCGERLAPPEEDI